MKIALFSDIHANLPALEGFFKDVEQKKVDSIYCLGDLVGYNIWPNEVIDEIRKRRIPAIAGNYDYGIGMGSKDCGCAYKTEEGKANGAISISFTNDIISNQNRKYLHSLPAHIRLEFKFKNDSFNVLLVHGSPRKINEYLFEERPEKSLLRIIEGAGTDILCFGHTHKPYHRILKPQDTDGNHKHAINVGSVGKPKDGDPRGCYVILEIDANTDLTNENGMKLEFVRFPYEVEKAAKAVEESVLPDVYATNLRTGL